MRTRDSLGRFESTSNLKKWFIKILWLLGIISLLTGIIAYFLAMYFETRTIVYDRVFTNNGGQFTFDYTPVNIVEREPVVILSPIVEQVEEETVEYEELTDVEKLICDKFGLLECKIALAVSLAENSKRDPEALNYNTNGSYDVGIFQINSLHWDEEYCSSLHELTTVQANIDCAYNIWDRADGEVGNEKGGWKPWTQFNNGVFINNL